MTVAQLIEVLGRMEPSMSVVVTRRRVVKGGELDWVGAVNVYQARLASVVVDGEEEVGIFLHGDDTRVKVEHSCQCVIEGNFP